MRRGPCRPQAILLAAVGEGPGPAPGPGCPAPCELRTSGRSKFACMRYRGPTFAKILVAVCLRSPYLRVQYSNPARSPLCCAPALPIPQALSPGLAPCQPAFRKNRTRQPLVTKSFLHARTGRRGRAHAEPCTPGLLSRGAGEHTHPGSHALPLLSCASQKKESHGHPETQVCRWRVCTQQPQRSRRPSAPRECEGDVGSPGEA